MRSFVRDLGLGLLGAGVKATRRRPGMGNCILVLQYMLPLGGCVHATPLFEAFARSAPMLPVVLATRGLGIEVAHHNPYLADILETADPLTNLSKAASDLRAKLDERGWVPGWTITDLSNQRSRIALMGALSTRSAMAGFSEADAAYGLALRRDKGISLINNNLRIPTELVGWSGHLEPRIFSSRAAVSKAEDLMQAVNPDGKPIALIVSQGSGGQATGWHDDRYRIVIRRLAELGMRVVLLGTARDESAIRRLREGMEEHTASLAGKTDISTLAAVIAMSDLMVTLDTGTMHVGRAVGIPMVVLGPSWQPAIEWLPLGLPQVRVLRGDDRTTVPDGYRLDEIEAADVVEAVDALLSLYPAAEVSRQERLRHILSDVDHVVKTIE